MSQTTTSTNGATYQTTEKQGFTATGWIIAILVGAAFFIAGIVVAKKSGGQGPWFAIVVGVFILGIATIGAVHGYRHRNDSITTIHFRNEAELATAKTGK